MGTRQTAVFDRWERHLGLVDVAYGGPGDFWSVNMWRYDRGLLGCMPLPSQLTPTTSTGTTPNFTTNSTVVATSGTVGIIGASGARAYIGQSGGSDLAGGNVFGTQRTVPDPGGGIIQTGYNNWQPVGENAVIATIGSYTYLWPVSTNAVAIDVGGGSSAIACGWHRDRAYLSSNNQPFPGRLYYGNLGALGTAAVPGTQSVAVGQEDWGARIHSVVSISAGLLIFTFNGVWILRGDPQGGDLRLLTEINTFPYARAVGDEVFAVTTEGDPLVISGQGAVGRPAPQFQYHSWYGTKWQVGGSPSGETVYLVSTYGDEARNPGTTAQPAFPGANPSIPELESLVMVRRNNVWVAATWPTVGNGIAWSHRNPGLATYDGNTNRFGWHFATDHPAATGNPVDAELRLPAIHADGRRLTPHTLRAYVFHFGPWPDAPYDIPSMNGSVGLDYRAFNQANVASGVDPIAAQQRLGQSMATPTVVRRLYQWNFGGAGWGLELRPQFTGIRNCAFERVEVDYEIGEAM